MKLIPLTLGLFTQVDDEDYDYLMQWKWHAHPSHNCCYAMRTIIEDDGKKKNIRMHREIMKPQEGEQIDHKDHNGLKNTRENLRIADYSTNGANNRQKPGISGYRGVSFTHSNHIRARIHVWGKEITLGIHETLIQAAEAYDLAALKYFGEFSMLNFPEKKDEYLVELNLVL